MYGRHKPASHYEFLYQQVLKCLLLGSGMEAILRAQSTVTYREKEREQQENAPVL
jgi:hypothetical protein